jgi:peptidyl-Lys metalloendopeptidase
MASRWDNNGGALNYASGQSDSLKLARDIPSEAIHNADNYEYFAENNPPQ